MSFPEILKDIMIERGLTQVAVANIIGIKQSQISEWLKGKAKPGYDMLRQMCVTLDVNASYLLGLTDY